jgi:hypothetical protein
VFVERVEQNQFSLLGMASRFRVQYVFVFILVFALLSLYNVQNWQEVNDNPWNRDVLLEWGRKGINYIQNADQTLQEIETSQEIQTSQEKEGTTEQIEDPEKIESKEDIIELILQKKRKWKEDNKNFPPPSASCKHTTRRNYAESPVVFHGAENVNHHNLL